MPCFCRPGHMYGLMLDHLRLQLCSYITPLLITVGGSVQAHDRCSSMLYTLAFYWTIFFSIRWSFQLFLQIYIIIAQEVMIHSILLSIFEKQLVLFSIWPYHEYCCFNTNIKWSLQGYNIPRFKNLCYSVNHLTEAIIDHMYPQATWDFWFIMYIAKFNF